MNFADMQAELSEILAESSTRTFSEAARKRWINEGVVDVCRLTRCLWREVAKDVVGGTQAYRIKEDWGLNDFLAFTEAGIRHYNGSTAAPVWTALERKSVEWLDENVPDWRDTAAAKQSDTILYYTVVGATATSASPSVYFYPTPKTSVTGGWLISYHYFPIDSATGTVGGLVNPTDIPFSGWPSLYPYHRLPVLFAAYRALLKAGSPKARQVMEEYVAGIRLMKQELWHEPDVEPKLALFDYRAR